RRWRRAREPDTPTREQQPSETRAILGMPARTRGATETHHGLELLDRLARSSDFLGECREREARLHVARRVEDAHRELAPRFDGPSRRDEGVDVERSRRAHASSRDE